MNRAAQMDSVPGNEIQEIKRKFVNADYLLRFINSVIKQFIQKCSEMDDFVITPGLFKIPKKLVLMEMPYIIDKMKLLQSSLSKSLMGLQKAYMIYI